VAKQKQTAVGFVVGLIRRGTGDGCPFLSAKIVYDYHGEERGGKQVTRHHQTTQLLPTKRKFVTVKGRWVEKQPRGSREKKAHKDAGAKGFGMSLDM